MAVGMTDGAGADEEGVVVAVVGGFPSHFSPRSLKMRRRSSSSSLSLTDGAVTCVLFSIFALAAAAPVNSETKWKSKLDRWTIPFHF